MSIMKTKDQTTRRPGRGWIAPVGVALALCALTVLAPARAGSNAPPTCPPGEASDDETIGTLPIIDDGSIGIDVVRFWADPRPSLFVQGTFDEIDGALLGVEGTGVATLQPVAGGFLRLTFYGDLTVLLDRFAVNEATSIVIGLSAQAPVAGETSLFWGGASRSLGAHSAGQLGLPVPALEASGALDVHALSAVTRYEYGERVVHRFETTSAMLVLDQSH
jgi:hypothetical protein